jgi:hypothetical protein
VTPSGDTTDGTTRDGRLAPTRATLHRIAAHVLGRARFVASGHFGLRAAPGGIATPPFGDDPDVLRISGTDLMREVGGACTWTPIPGSTLRKLGEFASVDLDASFSVGVDTPPLGDVDQVLEVSADSARTISDWFALCWQVLDSVIQSLPAGVTADTIQLWPENFDASTTIAPPSSEKVNLGFSPGDSFESGPYVYVGPWSAARPGDPGFWNAPFGAFRRRSELVGRPDPTSACREFLETGLDLVSSVPAAR